jgi:hypothetical protein
MAGGQRSLTIRFIGDSKDMKRGIKDVVSGLDDAESAGKRYAAAIDVMTGKAVQGAKEQRAAVDSLSQALGSDAVAAIERAGGSVDKWVGELSRAGLSLDELRADVDSVADAIRRAESANGTFDSIGTKARQASTQIDMVRGSADQSGSVLANMVGNSVQDLGALGGVAGTAGMALGQLAEYGTEGNISLAGLGKIAGPMVGVGIAVAGATWAIGKWQQAAKDAAEESENLRTAQEALAEGNFDDAARTLAEQYANTIPLLEKYGYSSKDLADTLGGQGDVIEALNVTLDDVHERYEAVQLDAYNGDEAAQTLSDSLGEQSEELISLIDTLTGARDEYQGIAEDTANRTALETDLAAALGASALATAESKDETEQFRKAQDNASAATRERLELERELYGFMMSQIDAQRAYEVAVDQGEDALRSFDEVMGNTSSTLEEIDDAARESADQLFAQADAFAKSKGAADGSKESIRLQIEELYNLASTMDPNSPLRSRLLEYIGELQSIPPTIDTMLRLNISQGATTTASGDFIGVRGATPRASGGPVWPGEVFAVGDNPDGSWNPTTELFVPSTPGTILSAADSRSALGGSGTTVIEQHFHVAPTADLAAIGRVTAEALLAYQAQAGPVFATVRG